MGKEEAFVVSDLHLGAGTLEPALEDFDQDDAFSDFVGRIARPGVTLFINGDFIDFPQIPPYDVPARDDLLWAEPASVEKVRAAIRAHPKVFTALAQLLGNGAQLRIHIGNHDLDLIWPQVQEILRGALQPPARDALEFTSYFDRYFGVHIEHGHMLTPENATEHPTEFVHEWPENSGTRYLERVWGTDFMLQYYNDLEREHPFADAVKPMITVLHQGLRQGWVGAREVVRLVVFLKRRGIPWRAIGSAVLADEKPLFSDVATAFDDQGWRQAVSERVRKDPDFRTAIDAELASLPEREQAIVAAPRRIELEASSFEEGGGATLGLFREDREVRAAEKRLAEPDVTHAVYGHTHAVVDGALGGHLFNPGTWLPRLDLGSPAVRAKIRAGGLTLAMLSDPSLYVAERWVAHIVPDPPRMSRVELVRA
jgi:UDP-2,3-diacylglucosamine pyrophosphatase LpxH